MTVRCGPFWRSDSQPIVAVGSNPITTRDRCNLLLCPTFASTASSRTVCDTCVTMPRARSAD
jgi:hypothetical protein